MEEITPKLAMEILQELKQSILYELHITDPSGKVIASTDPSKIWRPHLGAIAALANRSIIRVWDDSQDQKQGSSIPIVYRGVQVGALSVEGDVHDIEPVIRLLKTFVEMLIHQKTYMDSQFTRNQWKDQFLHEWLYIRDDYPAELRNRGHYLGIDVDMPRVAVVISMTQVDNPEARYTQVSQVLGVNDYLLWLSDTRLLALIIANQKTSYKLERIGNLSGDLILGVSNEGRHMFCALEEARKALELGMALKPEEKLHAFGTYSFAEVLSSNQNAEAFRAVVQKLVDEGENAHLLDTFIIYLQCNGDILRSVERLHIHRNSLQYRLKRIQEITGRDIRNYLDMLYMYTAYIIYTLNR